MDAQAKKSQSGQEIAPLIDHTLLKTVSTPQDIEAICGEAIAFGFRAVCVYPSFLPLVIRHLSGTQVLPCTVAGFPHGSSFPETKAFEAGRAAALGAREVDMVIALWAVKSHNYKIAGQEIRSVVQAAGPDCAVKVILETCLLTEEEKGIACRLAVDNGAAFVKTSTGFSSGGATVHDVSLMRQTVGNTVGVKASGGIRTASDALAMIRAGANRIGTSAGVQIVTEA